ncbi:MAG TPA: CocE/NonD family hydrolase [Polyangiales bacterium]|nr:CocE/NonD family hydrolase [Polyangiales bacterium]
MRVDHPEKLLLACVIALACAACSAKESSDNPSGASGAADGATAAPSGTSGSTPSSTPSAGSGMSAGAAGTKTPAAGSGSGTMAAGMSGSSNAGNPGSMEPTAGSAPGKQKPPPPPGSVSKPGEYSGYSEKKYNGYALSSEYAAMRDGVKLAVDLYRPKEMNGKVTETPLPVLWMHTPYNRRTFSSSAGSGVSGLYYPGAAAKLVDYGYVVAVVDFRGLFASYGKNAGYNRGEWMDAARMDAYDVTEWLAKQPWSTGKIGMWGCSATGGSQMQALTVAPPSLKAVFPMSCEFDVYPFGVPGGMSAGSGDTKTPPMSGGGALRDATAQGVDGDTGGAQLRAAIADHSGNIENAGYVPFRDSVASAIPEKWWIKSSPHTYLDAINESGIAVYAAANWDEAATKYGAFFTVNNLKNPTKLVVGPLAHCAWFSVEKDYGFDITVEEHRFFDYWLKGIENGVMDEDKVYYYTYNEAKGQEWRSSPVWPLANEKRVEYFLGTKTLSTAAPMAASGKDDAQVDYTVAMGTTSTTAPSNPNGIAYTSEPLTADVRVTGHPLAKLWVSSTATDGDFIATLQDVGPSGTITSYNMHGRLRASLRKEAPAPYNNLGLPWHPFGMGDVMPLTPGEPTLLQFDLLPISIVFKSGHRIQVKLSFADSATPRVTPAPTVSIYHDATHASSITLPIIE